MWGCDFQSETCRSHVGLSYKNKPLKLQCANHKSLSLALLHKPQGVPIKPLTHVKVH